jgi:hypothetical protein
MRQLASLLRAALLFVALVFAGAFFIAPALAQQNPPAPAAPVRYWPAGYGIAIMGIVLGLLIVLRPGTRGGEDEGR